MRKMVLGLFGAVLTVGGVQAEPPKVTMVHEALEQGGFFVGKVTPGSKVTLDGKALWAGPEGEIVIGFDRAAGPKAVLKVCDAGQCDVDTLAVAKRIFKTQNVTGIPPKTVEPSKAEELQIAEDNKATQAAKDSAAAGASERVAFMDGFALPVNGPTSGVFGSRRTYNGQERSWHKGHDLAVPTGTPVKAPADGVVRLARSTFMSGNLIMLDHGGGVTTVYAHLSEMNVAVGDKVSAGDVIGKVGTTGRSSGPHLHWGAYWRNVPIDPILWVAK